MITTCLVGCAFFFGLLLGCLRRPTLPEAMKRVIEAVRKDPDYAWSWHCNLSMSCQDGGASRAEGEAMARRFMQLLFGRCTSEEEYLSPSINKIRG